MKLLNYLTILIVLSLAACAVQKKRIQVASTFSEQENQQYTSDGKFKITGQAFLRQNGGGIVTCAGSEVILMPDTDFFNEIVMIAKQGNIAVFDKDYNFGGVTKKTMCDAQGNFVFNNIPKAKWIIGTDINWLVGNSSQGGSVMRKISVNEDVNILLTDKDRH